MNDIRKREDAKRERQRRGVTESKRTTNFEIDLRRLGMRGTEMPKLEEVNIAYKRICVRSKLSTQQKQKKERAFRRMLRRIDGKEIGSLESDKSDDAEC